MVDNLTINYIIATYSGISKRREASDNETDIILQKHMKVLCNSLKHTKHIKQVTIIKPHVEKESYENYYNINSYIADIEKIGIKVVICDTKIPFKSSYSQYIYAYKIFPEFDHYIIMEDDWVPFPTTKGFDTILLDTYKKMSNYNGFLSSWAPKTVKSNFHSAISVGIISNISFKQITKLLAKLLKERLQNNIKIILILKRRKNNTICDQIKTMSIGQEQFSELFKICSLPLPDYSLEGKNFMIPFWCTVGGVIYEYASYLSTKYLLVPIQLLDINKYKYIIASSNSFNNRPSKEVIDWVNNKMILKNLKNN